MQLSSRQLEAFVTVARTLNFTRAAERLNLTQSALSQRIRKLEEELGVTLLVRAPGGVRLTETGNRILRFCEARETLEAEILSDLATSRTGELAGAIRLAGHLSVMRTVALPALAPMLRANPKVNCELIVQDLKDLPTILKRGEADMVLLDSELPGSSLERHHLGDEVYVAIESTQHATRTDVWLDINPEDQVTNRFFLHQGQAVEFRRSFMADVYGIIDGVAMGVGRAVVPQHLLKGRQDIRVVPGFRPFVTGVWLHHFTLPYYSRLQQATLECLLRDFPAILQQT